MIPQQISPSVINEALRVLGIEHDNDVPAVLVTTSSVTVTRVRYVDGRLFNATEYIPVATTVELSEEEIEALSIPGDTPLPSRPANAADPEHLRFAADVAQQLTGAAWMFDVPPARLRALAAAIDGGRLDPCELTHRRIEEADDLKTLPLLSIVREVHRDSPSGANYGAVWELRRAPGDNPVWHLISGANLHGGVGIPAVVLYAPGETP